MVNSSKIFIFAACSLGGAVVLMLILHTLKVDFIFFYISKQNYSDRHQTQCSRWKKLDSKFIGFQIHV